MHAGGAATGGTCAGVLSLLRNPDTFSDKATEVATPIAKKCRGHPLRHQSLDGAFYYVPMLDQTENEADYSDWDEPSPCGCVRTEER